MASSIKWLRPNDVVLLLEDGTRFVGKSFGSKTQAFGEVVFNTAMCGYQEVLTDPSYWQQLVVMTYSHQGNYGINAFDNESSDGPKVSGFIVHEFTENPSNSISELTSLSDYLERHSIPGIWGIDTRALTLHIREKGAMRGLILSAQESEQIGNGVSAHFSKLPVFEGRDLILEVTTKKPYWFEEDEKKKGKTVVAIDFGVKTNLLREISMRGARVVVLPATASAEDVQKYNPDGVFLSNGPGDPQASQYAVKTVRALLGKKPIFGVCMGHQILSLALGAKTYKMKFGHRGINQPVLNTTNQKVEISSHNHGFAVDVDSLPAHVKLTHRNLNDGCCEGIECAEKNAFSVQYHPEAAPGPRDSGYLFDEFIRRL